MALAVGTIMGLVRSGIKLLGAGANVAVGYSDRKKGIKALGALGDRPEYEIPDEIGRNQALAQYYATSGLDADTMYNYKQNLERGLSANNNAVLQAGGSINSVNRGYDQYQQGLGKVAQLNFQALQANRQALMEANKDKAFYDDQQFAFKLKNWNVDREEALNLKREGTTSMTNGFSQFGKGLMSAGSDWNKMSLDKGGGGNGGSVGEFGMDNSWHAPQNADNVMFKGEYGNDFKGNFWNPYGGERNTGYNWWEANNNDASLGGGMMG